VRTFRDFVETTPGVLSEMCTPIVHKGRVVAVLNIESTRLAAFRNDLPLLLTVADQIAGAIAFARAYEETRRWARLMEMTSEVTRTALEETDLDRLLDRIVGYIHQHFPLEVVTVLLYDAETQEYVQTAAAGEITLVSSLRAPVTSGLIGRCITSGQTQLLEDVSLDPAYIPLNARVVAELAVPIRCQGEMLGALNLESSSAAVFSSRNVLAFEAFAGQVAGAIRLASIKRQLEEANRELRTLSATDALTGLANRRSFDDRLLMEWRRGIRAKQPLSILFIDVDQFKSYNDLYGHQAGDECLRTIATTLGVALQRSTDFVARYGGEEFAVLLAETDGAKAAAAADIARTTVECLSLPHSGSPTGVVTISIGCATVVPVGAMKPEDLMQRADEALYEAKRSGRNCVVSG
jgi:diguanylate cyclase (GGDEF)-like protein